MSTTLATCNHLHDNGGTCNSVAAKHQHYCVYHLRHRARLMRMAQARARSERFDLKLPPLESMHAVQSALTQLMEAVAADMVDLKRADRLIAMLRVASRNLLKADKWPAASVFHSDHAADVDVAAEYGLPHDVDVDTPLAFPPPPEPAFSGLSSRAQPAASAAGVETPVFSSPVDNRQPTADNSNVPVPPPLPYSGDYCGDHHTSECECLRIRADHPITPEMVECLEISQTHGPDVAAVRRKQLSRNSERRRLNRDRKRYAAIALEHNLRRAADRLAEQKIAALRASSGPSTADSKKPPSSAPDDTNFAREAELTSTGSHG